MEEIIQLLPDHLANQIAAGEVIQRPASAVKELLENAIDAEATDIQLIIKDAGKELIQVVDNGKGMSAMDARMSFERHATSKIRKIEDLFAIATMGFRGEALASIAAVAQVELKTKRRQDDLGTLILLSASKVEKQEPTATPNGTSFAIKNLFYNVPARRKFLKSNTTEYKNILEEFSRVALAYPDISFKLYHNNQEQMFLTQGNLKSRITGLLGTRLDKHLIPVKEETEVISIKGYVGKPEAASKTRGNQFFFVNNRYIKSPFLHHAVCKAFEGLIEKDSHPTYAIYFELDPSRVDVNVHPTKQEVKFDDEQMLYAYIQSAVKHALSVNNVAPSIDFTLNSDINNLEAVRMPPSEQDVHNARQGYLSNSFSEKGKAHFIDKKDAMREWSNQRAALYDPFDALSLPSKMNQDRELPIDQNEEDDDDLFPMMQPSAAIISDIAVPNEINFDIDQKHEQASLQWDEYLISTMKSGILVMHKKRAYERIIFEKLQRQLAHQKPVCQSLLFPETIQLAPADSILLESILPTLHNIGYEITPLGNHTYCIQGAPPDAPSGRESQLLEDVIDQLKNEVHAVQNNVQLAVLRTVAKRLAQPSILKQEEATALIDELFACDQPQYTPDGQTVFNIMSKSFIGQLI